jgi:hypothetical protein
VTSEGNSTLTLHLATAGVRPGGRPLAAREPNRTNAPFGLPGPAAADLKHREAYLIERPQYVLSYKVGDEAERQVYIVGKTPDDPEAVGEAKPTPRVLPDTRTVNNPPGMSVTPSGV